MQFLASGTHPIDWLLHLMSKYLESFRYASTAPHKMLVLQLPRRRLSLSQICIRLVGFGVGEAGEVRKQMTCIETTINLLIQDPMHCIGAP